MTNKTWKPWTPASLRALATGSKKRTAVRSLSRILKRSETAIRQKARELGLGLGPMHRGITHHMKRKRA